MPTFLIAILAYFLNGVAVVIDKILLTKSFPNPLIYIFYFSAFSALALLIIPFTKAPSLQIFLISSVYTLLWTVGAYCMYKGLQIGQVTRVIPVIGALVPLILLFYYGVIAQNLASRQLEAALVLLLGLIFLILPNLTGKISTGETILELLSGFFFAISYIVLKIALLGANFVTILVWSRLILIPVGLIILLLPNLRQTVLAKNNGSPAIKILSITGLLFIIGQASGGSAQILLTIANSLANPAIVNSLQGTQYIFLFLAGILLAKKYPQIFSDKLTVSSLTSKLLGIILVGGGLFLLAF